MQTEKRTFKINSITSNEHDSTFFNDYEDLVEAETPEEAAEFVNDYAREIFYDIGVSDHGMEDLRITLSENENVYNYLSKYKLFTNPDLSGSRIIEGEHVITRC